MKPTLKPSSGIWLALAGLGIVLVAFVAFLAMRGNDVDEGPGQVERKELSVDPAVYRQMVSAFYTGVAAIDADANDRAKQEMTLATELVPAEPAGWMNLALVGIRLDEVDAAVQALEEARKLAPDDATVDRLFGLLESRRGNSDAAVKHFRQAVEKDPGDVRSAYALAEEIERRGEPGSGDEAAGLLAEILERRPNNLAVLLERARLAVKADDAQALSNVVERLRPFANAWPERTVEQFRTLEEAAAEGITGQTAIRVAVMRNLLVAEPAFRASLAEVKSSAGVVGEPVRTFLKLPPPPPTPAPADTGLAFEVEPIGEDDRVAAALIAVPRVGDRSPALIVADGRTARTIADVEQSIPFPGGAEHKPPGPHGMLAVDWNSDYAIDLVLAGAGGVRLLQVDEAGTFQDVTDATGIAEQIDAKPANGVWAADLELDGDLDLFVGWTTEPVTVLQNNGDGTFAVQQPFEGVSDVQAFVWCALDRGGIPDAAFLDGDGKLHVFDNQRSGRFERRELPDDLGTLVAATVADLDADGLFELVALRDDGTIFSLSNDGGTGDWRSVDVVRWDEAPESGARLAVADLDNNGSVDLIGTGPGNTRIWLRDGSGKMQSPKAGVDFEVGAILDLTDDGRLDLAGLSGDRKPVRGTGQGTKEYHWQSIEPRAANVKGDSRINSFGLGGEVEVRSGLLVQTQSIGGPTLHFGLGDHPGADIARIVWPNGTVQVEFDTNADQEIAAEQRLKGSCPFVFADDGTGMRFVTDFLWRSPLGLRINAQDTAGAAQTEDWIRITGDQLKPRDGHYDVRITAELWETHYFDQMSLMVVDHPPGTAVFVDERFAKSPPALKLHPTGPLHPVSARDDTGQDVTDVVRSVDGRYLDSFGLGDYQGVTRDHWVEIEIGDDVPSEGRLQLVARGWVYPTDSSINVALAQGSHDPPQGLALEVPDGDGGWKIARPDLGFPAGKDKTIVIDLDGLFSARTPRRFRLRTNLEVYWDQLAVAVAGEPSTLRTQRLDPVSAELRHRGYSLMTRADRSAPEIPDYNRLIGTSQRWRDLIGYYTRFGDVRTLLEEVDDRYVIANAGDEVALRFAEPPPPPDGWIRDFVLIGDGWNKDGDYNTAFSETVLPLPSHSRPEYDTPPGDLEDDPVYRKNPTDWERYHTRYVTPEAFGNGLRPPGGNGRAHDSKSEGY